MTTGACGINCNACRLFHQGICSSCGSGVSQAGREKLRAQIRILGSGCPILQCAIDRHVRYCMLDCEDFPCDQLTLGKYPFSPEYLDMHRRRRHEAGGGKQAAWPKSSPEFWEKLEERSIDDICSDGLATRLDHNSVAIQCLNESWNVDIKAKTIRKDQGIFGGEWDRQLPFLILVYLVTSNSVRNSGHLTSPEEIFHGITPFSGVHSIKTKDFESMYGRNKGRFQDAAYSLGGRKTQNADISALFYLFPKLPVELLLWLADEEFPAKVTLLFDQNLARILPVDLVAATVNLLIGRLIHVGQNQ